LRLKCPTRWQDETVREPLHPRVRNGSELRYACITRIPLRKSQEAAEVREEGINNIRISARYGVMHGMAGSEPLRHVGERLRMFHLADRVGHFSESTAKIAESR